MKKIIDYLIAYGKSVHELKESVDLYIIDGYQPYGSPFFTEYKKIAYREYIRWQDQRYHQAMVKYEEA